MKGELGMLGGTGRRGCVGPRPFCLCTVCSGGRFPGGPGRGCAAAQSLQAGPPAFALQRPGPGTWDGGVPGSYLASCWRPGRGSAMWLLDAPSLEARRSLSLKTRSGRPPGVQQPLLVVTACGSRLSLWTAWGLARGWWGWSPPRRRMEGGRKRWREGWRLGPQLWTGRAWRGRAMRVASCPPPLAACGHVPPAHGPSPVPPP